LPLNLSALSDVFDVPGGLPGAELEIGFGNGEFTAQYAAARPDTLLIGLEVSPACIERCVRRMNGSLSNLKVICADARFMMKELFADASLDRVVMNFPCPWPKNRHARRRVTAEGFADDLAAVLKIGGVFEMLTDVDWYAADAQKAFGEHEALSAAECETNPARVVTTKYERKWLEMGKNITRLLVTKTKPFTVERQTWRFYEKSGEEGTEERMHVRTGKPLPGEGLGFLAGASGAWREARWVFKKYYTAGSGADRVYLVETVSADDGFEQRYYLKAAGDGDALVKLDGTSRVYLTPSVRCAIEDLARRLSEHAELTGGFGGASEPALGRTSAGTRPPAPPEFDRGFRGGQRARFWANEPCPPEFNHERSAAHVGQGLAGPLQHSGKRGGDGFSRPLRGDRARGHGGAEARGVLRRLGGGGERPFPRHRAGGPGRVRGQGSNDRPVAGV
jgi:tRNA (guanine-N7-)-methyltransferase